MLAIAFLADIGRALSFAFGTFWEILWALILGFAISAAVQAAVSKSEMARRLPDDSPRSLATASGLGMASSSYSYAALALARAAFREGANLTAAVTFAFASTNLVVPLGIVVALLVGWQFTVAEFVGGTIAIVVLALLFRVLLTGKMIEEARRQPERGLRELMKGHAEMGGRVKESGSSWSRLTSAEGFTAISHCFVMDWAAI